MAAASGIGCGRRNERPWPFEEKAATFLGKGYDGMKKYELTLPPFNAKIIGGEGRRQIFDPVRKKYVALTPEEWVRQHFVNYLVTTKGYPLELMANEVQIRLNHTAKRCDTVLYDRLLQPRMIVEYKAPTVEITQDVFEQIVRYNMALHVKYLVVSNGIRHICCEIDYLKGSCEFLSEVPLYSLL